MGAEERLTSLKVKSLKEPGKYFDGHGLHLLVDKNGHRYWRWKYRFGGRENTLSFGVYPEVSLAEARSRHQEARAQLRAGKNPSAVRKSQSLAARRERQGEFRRVAASWLAHEARDWSRQTHAKARLILNDYLFPALRGIAIAELTSRQASEALERMADVPSLAVKGRQYLDRMVVYAIRHGLRDEGRMLLLDGALRRRRGGHIPARTQPDELAKVVRAIDTYPTEVTRAALQFLLLTALRPGEVVGARWEEINLQRREWLIPADRMKTGHAHLVPLPDQAIVVLRRMHAYTAGTEYVFPPLARQGTPHLSRDTLSQALRNMGFRGKQAPHGLRASFRTIARERLGIPADVLEAQLAHAKKGEVQKAYDHTLFDEERRQAMQRWADYLDELRGLPEACKRLRPELNAA